LLQVKGLALFGFPKPRWLLITLRDLVMLTKPNHRPSEPIDDPREAGLTELRLHWLKDSDGNSFEILISRRAFAGELCERVANLIHSSIKLFLRQFSRYRFNNALCQIRNFDLHIEGRMHHLTSF
jgi:hypothetical protein